MEKTPTEYLEFLQFYIRDRKESGRSIYSHSLDIIFDVSDIPEDISFAPSPINELVEIYKRTNILAYTNIFVYFKPSMSEELTFSVRMFVSDPKPGVIGNTFMIISDYMSKLGEHLRIKDAHFYEQSEYHQELLTKLQENITACDMLRFLNIIAYNSLPIYGPYGVKSENQKFYLRSDIPRKKSAKTTLY